MFQSIVAGATLGALISNYSVLAVLVQVRDHFAESKEILGLIHKVGSLKSISSLSRLNYTDSGVNVDKC